MSLPKKVKIVEVSPRDGLQNETRLVPTAVKINFINQLSETGLSVIEATSFVSPRWVPQFADHAEVFARIIKEKNIRYPVLIPNLRGLEKAIAAGVKDIAVFTSPSEEFSKHNINCTVAESLARISEVIAYANKYHLAVRGYISCVLGCPYEGEMKSEKVLAVAKELFNMGCEEISLGDTIGVGTALKTKQLIELIAAHIPINQIAVHFHDTYGQALANIYAALECGVAVIDSSVAGLGGCPYAKGASGNVATEDVLYMLQGMHIETGVDLKKILAVGEFISKHLRRESQSKVSKAMLRR